MKGLSTTAKLCVASLFFGLLFWYGIEQLFLNKIIGNPAARGYVTIIYTATLLLLNVPAGILADRWGRKKALILGAIIQTVSSFIMGASHLLVTYLVGAAILGVHASLLNGAAQALLYDDLASEGRAKQYARQQGKVYACFLLGAGIANLLSGIIASKLGLRLPYYLSIISGLLALSLVLTLSEPALKKQAVIHWYRHMGDMLREIKINRLIIILFLQFMIATSVLSTIGEFGQIYILSFGVSTIALGVLWAIDAGFAAMGRFFAHFLQSKPFFMIGLYCTALIMLVTLHSIIGIALFWIVYGLNEALFNVIETEVQHATSSQVRATTISAMSFGGQAVTIPIVLWFTQHYTAHGILSAYRSMAILAVVGLLILLAAQRWSKRAVANA